MASTKAASCGVKNCQPPGTTRIGGSDDKGVQGKDPENERAKLAEVAVTVNIATEDRKRRRLSRTVLR
ncbi:hypothetical protein [Mesorhizobium sp. LNHC232B00]|uniref:hypothetical protein n=1 Tax=Mesorhizobium sp. LNHC232B00 TaxID=1287243 RepID=UPI0003CE9250|nr:hypothetical protein [Mesorhizobium sp. LNHC232B00]ESY67307.1 hypothetical protein X742_16500 [Mesorhizobium sp. LNHC232B00]